MTKQSSNRLEHLLKLAREYDRKYRELILVSEKSDLNDLLPQLIQQAELATDRFRAAQQSFYSSLGDSRQDADKTIHAANCLGECFDEVLILFHVLTDKVRSS